MTNRIGIISFSLLMVVVAILATATVIERVMGTDVVNVIIYDAWWFAALWAALAVTAIVVMFKTGLFKRPLTLMLHLALLLILAGAFTTWLFSQTGTMTLNSDGIAVSKVNSESGDGTVFELPFSLSLSHFEVVNYEGTPTPMDFVSDIVVNDAGKQIQGTVSMNNVFSYQGYRFFQSGFSADGDSTILKVQHDPVGIGITYTGYVILLLSFILFYFDKKSEFRRIIAKLRLQRLSLIVALLVSVCNAEAAPPTVSAPVARQLDSLYVLYNGRICPFATLAADFTVKLCGKRSYNGLNATQVLAGWMFYPADWENEPIIKVKSPDVRSQLGINGKMARVEDFYTSTLELKLQPMINAAARGDKNVDERGLAAVNEQFALINMASRGNMLKIYPVVSDSSALEWYSPADRLPASLPDEEYVFISKGFGYLNELIQAGDEQSAVTFLSKLRLWQRKQAGELLPSDNRISAELSFNHLSKTRPVAMTAMTLGILAFIIFCMAMARKRQVGKIINLSLTLLMALLWLYLTALLALRWIAGGHVPLSNGSETMHFMSWSVATLTLCLCRRFKLILPMGMLMSGLTLMVAMMGEATPKVTLLMPVLQSPLLSIHVMVIMIAYSLFAFMLLNGIAAIALRRDAEAVETLALISRVMLYPAVMLLAIGIFIGAVWANVSWGRYWGWDPKEVWALITLLIYCLPLHSRSIPALARPQAFHIFAVVAFLSVLITYFGVNFLLGGQHAYV